MSLATRLIELLQEQSSSLRENPAPAEQAQVASVALIGSLARGDFRTGGSDVDLMFVHGLGERPAAEVAAAPSMRRPVGFLGEPLLQAGGGTGAQKPFLIDCHFVEGLVLATQPRWAEPSQFTLQWAERETYLWLYAFDLVRHIMPLSGPSPAIGVRAYDPAAYTETVLRQLRQRLAALRDDPPANQVEAVNAWKLFAGRLLTALALSRGGRSLKKNEIYRDFNTLVPHFPGKDFAASLWAEYLYGSVFQDREDWLQRCRKFCEEGLATL